MIYEFAWSFDTLPVHTLRVTDAGGTVDLPFDQGFYAHTEFAHRGRTYASFAGALEAELNASALAETYTVSWSRTTGYTVSVSGGLGAAFSLDFTGDARRIAMGQLLGFTGTFSGVAFARSNARPYYVIIPATPAPKKPEEYQPTDIVTEGATDGGTTSQISRYTSEAWMDWAQPGEDPLDLPAEPFDPGTPVYRRQETTELPWSYQRAWAHHKAGFHPFLLEWDGETLHRMRAEGAAFRPQRMSTQDFELWTVLFRTRLLGRLS